MRARETCLGAEANQRHTRRASAGPQSFYQGPCSSDWDTEVRPAELGQDRRVDGDDPTVQRQHRPTAATARGFRIVDYAGARDLPDDAARRQRFHEASRGNASSLLEEVRDALPTQALDEVATAA